VYAFFSGLLLHLSYQRFIIALHIKLARWGLTAFFVACLHRLREHVVEAVLVVAQSGRNRFLLRSTSHLPQLMQLSIIKGFRSRSHFRHIDPGQVELTLAIEHRVFKAKTCFWWHWNSEFAWHDVSSRSRRSNTSVETLMSSLFRCLGIAHLLDALCAQRLKPRQNIGSIATHGVLV